MAMTNAERTAKWRASNLDSIRSQTVVRAAVRSGLLVRPRKCSLCFRIGPVDAAVLDRAHPLVVTWCCRSCHVTYVRALKRASLA